jgi:hypothetical protein
MSGIHSSIFTAVCRLRITFHDGIGNQKTILGTGFWCKLDQGNALVTNKHNLDPRLKLGDDTVFLLSRVEVQLRRMVGAQLFPETAFFEVQNVNDVVRLHAAADVAALLNPTFDAEGFGFNWFSLPDIADQNYLANSASAMDIASFIGFPGLNGNQWWDEQWQTPIARVSNIASWPASPFINAGIKTGNVCLVSGLSFSGSSGSPIVLHEKGIRVGGGLTGGNYIAPKVIGIMSGHWWGTESPGDMFFHSGLSYFTRSTSILELLGA